MHGDVFIVAEFLTEVNSWEKFVKKVSTPRNDVSRRKVNSSELATITYISDDQSSEFNLPLVPVISLPGTGLKLGDD